jgi:hypothetical protein
MGMEKLQPVQLELAKVRIDGGTQARAALNDAAVDEYAELIIDGANMPPIVVFFDGSAHWLADGFHRYHAHRKAEKRVIAAEIRNGTVREAKLFSFGANGNHGLRRTNADKHRVAKAMLEDAEWSRWSDNKIAQQCGVSQPFISSIRSSLITVISDKPERTYTNKQGKPARMKTARIGKSKGKKPSKILPRPEAISKPDSLDVAREHAKKQNAAIKELRASVAERDAHIEALTKELRESRDNAAELAESLDACIKAGEGDTAAAKEIKRLLGQIRVLEATRDQYMTKCNELVKTVKSLQRKAEKKP